MKPLISYYGGKQKIASKIVEQIDKIEHKIYAEPFCGGCAVLFEKPIRRPRNTSHYREAINDTNELVVNLYRVAREQPEELERWLKMTPYSRADYKRAKLICSGEFTSTDLEKAWALYVNAQMSFANKLGGGWGVSLQTESRAAKSQATAWKAKQSRLNSAIDRLSKVHIDCQDALTFIDQWDHPDTLFYVDPPYPSTNQGHYKGYTLADFKALCEKLDSIKGSYLLSNYPQTIEPKSAKRRIELRTTMSASKDKTMNKKRTEFLWICDRNPVKNREQLSLLDSLA